MLLLAFLLRILKINIILESLRGVAYFTRAAKSDVILFDQVLKAFGCMSLYVLLWLSRIFGKRVVVTVHEIDPMQLAHPRMNRIYNSAERVLVYSESMRQQMERLGVSTEKLIKIHYPVKLASMASKERRSNYVFFGGDHPDGNKGIATLIGAVRELKDVLKEGSIIAHTGNNCVGIEEVKAQIHSLCLDHFFKWIEFKHGSQLLLALSRVHCVYNSV